MEEFWTDKQKENLNFFPDNIEKPASDQLYKLKYIIQQVVSDKETVSFLFSAIKVA